MRNLLVLALGLAALATQASSLLAQATTTSPTAYATSEGNTFHGYPLSNRVLRYMQVHGDLRGRSLTVGGLAFRRDGNYAVATGAARQIEVEVRIGNATYTTAGATFDSNWLGAPTTVLPRQWVNLPDWSQGPSEGARAKLLFGTSWAFTGANDLAWEMRVYNSTAGTDQDLLAADAFDEQARVDGAQRKLGIGCITKAGPSPMELLATPFRVDTTSFTLSMGWQVTNVSNASGTCLLGLGFGAVNLPVPQLCGHGLLITIPQLLIAAPISAQTANFGPFSLSYWPGLTGVQLHFQALAPDYDQLSNNLLPFSTANGLMMTIPPLAPPLQPVLRLHNSSSATSPTGTLERNRGVVTDFL